MEAKATARRRFLVRACGLLGGFAGAAAGRTKTMSEARQETGERAVTLFLSGDVMTGRGIDQVLLRPGDPVLHEPYATSALDYVALAERRNGPITSPVTPGYIWGDALAEWARARPDLRIVNLETAVTARGDWERDKRIHYRMHPDNVPVLAAAAIDCCVLANNHVLDWGRTGLADTLASLRGAGMHTAGAGRDAIEAAAPAVLPVAGRGRVLVFAFGAASSGIASAWAAGANQPGVNLLADLSDATLARIAAQVRAVRHPGDLAVASIHWGENWGYGIPEAHRTFARGLVERCGVDVVHGHSSHHPLGIEVVAGRPILYGCGDFINDYEGIGGYETYRGDLSLMYFLRIDLEGRLQRLWMRPLRMRRFRLEQASQEDARWLRETLDRESGRLGCRVEAGTDGSLELRWA